jgi:hypothetical protein
MRTSRFIFESAYQCKLSLRQDEASGMSSGIGIDFSPRLRVSAVRFFPDPRLSALIRSRACFPITRNDGDLGDPFNACHQGNQR